MLEFDARILQKNIYILFINTQMLRCCVAPLFCLGLKPKRVNRNVNEWTYEVEDELNVHYCH